MTKEMQQRLLQKLQQQAQERGSLTTADVLDAMSQSNMEDFGMIMEALQERFHTVNNDTGISFAVPLSSVIGKLSYGFLSNDKRMVEKNG